ncbi:MAG TPA: exosortase/archaeosortase family protein, partial [Capsulimonadaceae bacterium]|nr:exosortase/archaeosortase family protein [Capsulimonadaceae bacterium]
MQSSLASTKSLEFGWQRVGWLLIPILALLLWVPEVQSLWFSWKDDPSLSHGPLVPLITAALLWMRRAELRRWRSAAVAGLVLLALSTLLYIGSVWADIDFLRPLCLIAMAAGVVWFLGGWRSLTVAIGALGFLIFMIPWPTTLVAYLAFPMQLASSTYAAQMAGMLGLPIERNGVDLSVVPNLHAPPVYTIVVAQACSGLTSVIVLLALAYLISYHTKIALGWRALLMASVIPMALFMNSVRLTAVLMAGAHYNAAVAQWIHDHEEPVLVFFCSFG